MHTSNIISEIWPKLVAYTRISLTYRTPNVKNFPPDSSLLVRPRSKPQLSVLISVAPAAVTQLMFSDTSKTRDRPETGNLGEIWLWVCSCQSEQCVGSNYGTGVVFLIVKAHMNVTFWHKRISSPNSCRKLNSVSNLGSDSSGYVMSTIMEPNISLFISWSAT